MKNKLYEMLKDLQNDNDLGGFNEFPQFCEDFLFDAIVNKYLSVEGRRELEWRIKCNFRSDINNQKYEKE